MASSAILADIKGLVGYLSTIQNSDGSVDVAGLENAQATSILAYGGATLLKAGDTSYQAQTLKAMNWAANTYRTMYGTNTTGPDFVMAPLAKAYTLLAASGRVSQSTLDGWKSDITSAKDYAPNDGHNWGAYASDGAWQLAKAGLIGDSAAQDFVEKLWTGKQANTSPSQKLDLSSPNGLYMDGSGPPDSMSVEAAGRGFLLDMVASGYNGSSASAIMAAVSQGTATSLLLQDPSGQAPTGGRTSDHVWTDAGYESIFETVAQNTSDPTLAGQYQRAADLAFGDIQRWRHSNGSYSVTKNFYPDQQRVGYQNASDYVSYNANVLEGLAGSYNAIARTVTPVAAPVEIGGYSFNTGSDWDTAFAAAGGTAIEVETKGDTGPSFGNHWNALGVVRIGSTGFDTRLGPSDGRYNGTDGVSFAPTWKGSNGGWQHLAGNPGSYGGSFTTVLATPVLTIDQIVWKPNSGASGPTFTQTLDITPDGVFSRVTAAGASSGWGMTLPLLASDGQTSTAMSTSGGIAQVSGYGSTESFIALDPTATLATESQIQSTYGEIMPVRATGKAAEQDVFVYQGQSGISAAALKSGFVVTPSGYSSAIGWVNGTLYAGQTSAGGWGSSIALSGSGTPDASFSTACNFILQVSNGAITAVEADRNVTATIGGTSYNLAAYSPRTVSGSSAGSGGGSPTSPAPSPTPAPTPAKTLTLTAPSGIAFGQAFTIAGTDNFTLPASATLLLDGASSTVAIKASGTSFTLPGPATLASGSHTAQLVVGSTDSNIVDFTVAAKAPVAGPIPVPAPSGSYDISSGWAVLSTMPDNPPLSFAVAYSASERKVALWGDKKTGSNAAIKLWVDKKYVGTFLDNRPDGFFNRNLTGMLALSSGSHTVTLTSSNNATATLVFAEP